MKYAAKVILEMKQIAKDCKQSVQITAFIPPDMVYHSFNGFSFPVRQDQRSCIFGWPERFFNSDIMVLSSKSDHQSGTLITVENESAVRYDRAVK